jgi:hypothetical protein
LSRAVKKPTIAEIEILEVASKVFYVPVAEEEAAEAAPDVQEEEVTTAVVKDTHISVPSIEEASPLVEEHEFLTSADSGATVPAKES